MNSIYCLNLNNLNDYQHTYQTNTNTNQTPRRLYQESFPNNQQTHFRTESILHTHNSLSNNNINKDDTLLSHNFYNHSNREPITLFQRNNSSIQRIYIFITIICIREHL